MSDTDVDTIEDTDALALLEETGSSLAIGLTRAELDTQIATARRFPRQLSRVAERILSLATLDDETAEECMFALPRAGKPIKGPSIRFAEIVAQSFGNNRVSARTTHIDRTEKFVEAEGIFLDLETNAARKVAVRRRILDKKGRIYNDDMINVTANAACAIAARNAILGGVPKALWRRGYEAVVAAIAGDVATLSETREKAIRALATFGLTPEQIFHAVGVKGAEDVTLEHITLLRGMFSALKNGEATVEEMLAGTSRRGSGHSPVENPLSDEAPAPVKVEEPAESSPAAPTVNVAQPSAELPLGEQPSAKGGANGIGPDAAKKTKGAGTAVPSGRKTQPAPDASPGRSATFWQGLSAFLMRAKSIGALEPAALDYFQGELLEDGSIDSVLRTQIIHLHKRRITKEIFPGDMDAELAKILREAGK